MGAILPGFCDSLLPFSALQKWPFQSGFQFKSDWKNWPDMKWVGPEYWGNRLQDWEVKNGKTVCNVLSGNRNLHLLAIQKPKTNVAFRVSVEIEKLFDVDLENDSCFGIRLGAKGPFEDYRSAAVFGQGLDVGINSFGNLKIGDLEIETKPKKMPEHSLLVIECIPIENQVKLIVSVVDQQTRKELYIVEKEVDRELVAGNFALLAHSVLKEKNLNQPSVAFSNWAITSENLDLREEQLFGPIYFAQYTLNKGKLKLTAQLAPVESIKNHSLELQIKKDGAWETLQKKTITNDGRAVNFKIENWSAQEDTPYRLLLSLFLKNNQVEFEYNGTIAAEPTQKDDLKAAVFSCNFHHGFPDSDIVENVSKLHPDVILFLGDQFYEATGGFGVDFTGSYESQCLDYLRKWIMFGWSYRELFRHKPCAIIPDDHDVFHGNVWGEAGKKADTTEGWGAPAQDSGGYKMSAKWMNMVQFTQTSHLPDPYDPSPVKQNIGVYYTHWNYGGISFAIIEDRKFKSAPAHVLPIEAEIWNGWIQNKDFDIKEHRNAEATLLGERQLNFLKEWCLDWSNHAEMKCLLSQTNFATVATLPEEETNDANVPSLPIPKRGEYVLGDQVTVDMDSNGWPSKGRDRAVEILRKCFSFHIAGDQHLASFIQYGLEEHGDSGYAFASPALNNIWPRRFWPPNTEIDKHSYENPSYVGDHFDGFGNRMTVKAVANPFETNREPKIIHNRATGYGLVTFNKKERTIITECWPRYVNPLAENSQFAGWPIIIQQEENYSKKAIEFLPTLEAQGNFKPLVEIYHEDDTLIYAIRMKDGQFQPKVFERGEYKIRITNTETGESDLFTEKSKKRNRKRISL